MRAQKKDTFHHDVVKAFEALFWHTEDMTARTEFCDIFVTSPDKSAWAWIEIKTGEKKKLTKGEVKFMEKCLLKDMPWYRCNGPEEVPVIIKEILLRFAL
tara:strand:+ start:31118 stop:31417 length:300 start_codon:yes stop_codon:yes gene_type:complete